MMTGRPGWLSLISRCCVVAVSAAILATATGQARGAGTVARAHGLKRPATFSRCAVRNSARGTARIAENVAGGGLTGTQNLNPYQGNNPPAGLFESYFVFDNNLKMIPVMATAVPTLKNGGIRDGGETVILHLKRGLRWSNGVEITSADARFGWQIDADKATGPVCGGPCGEIRTVETPGRYTVIYRLRHVTPSFLTDGLPSIWPTRWQGAWNGNPHLAALKLGTDPTFTFKGPNYPTDGPYQVARVLDNKQIVLKPMKYYSTMSCGGFIGTIIDEVEGTLARMLGEAVTGHLDLWYAGARALAALPEIQRHSGYTLHLDPAFQLELLEFNLDPKVNGAANPLHDEKVRQALALALDKQLLLRRVLPLSARQARGLLAWTPWLNTPKLVQQYADRAIGGQWDPFAKAYVTDTGRGRALADARKLLTSTRWKKGFTLDHHTLDTPQRQAAVPVLTAAWARLGVTVKPTIHAVKNGQTTLFDSWDKGGLLAHGAFQSAELSELGASSPDSWVTNLGSQYIERRRSDHSGQVYNDSGIASPVIDHAFQRAGRTVDNKVRARSFAVIQREVNRHAYWVPLYFLPAVWIANGHIRNVSYSARNGIAWNTWAWKVGGR